MGSFSAFVEPIATPALQSKLPNVGDEVPSGPSTANSTSSRCACKYSFVFLTRVGNVVEYGADDVHPIVDVDEIHCRDNEQGHAEIAAISAVARGAGQTSYARAHKEVRECPFIARGPDLSEG